MLNLGVNSSLGLGLQSCAICTIIPWPHQSLLFNWVSIQRSRYIVEHHHLRVFFSWHYRTHDTMWLVTQDNPLILVALPLLCIFVKVPHQFSWSVAFSEPPLFEVQVVFKERTLLLKNYVKLSLLWNSWILNWPVERLSLFGKHCSFDLFCWKSTITLRCNWWFSACTFNIHNYCWELSVLTS